MPLHRPYIRSSVRAEVEKRAPKNEKGQFLDANTGRAIEGQYDLGHKQGHEHWREAEKAEKEGLTQEQFNERMNNPDYYQIEDPHENRSHVHEQPKNESFECGKSPTGNQIETINGTTPDQESTKSFDPRIEKSAVTQSQKSAEEAAKVAQGTANNAQGAMKGLAGISG